jgi:CcmD family protein
VNVQNFLFHYGQYVAYAAAWVIHGTYLGILVRRRARLRRELDRLK